MRVIGNRIRTSGMTFRPPVREAWPDVPHAECEQRLLSNKPTASGTLRHVVERMWIREVRPALLFLYLLTLIQEQFFAVWWERGWAMRRGDV